MANNSTLAFGYGTIASRDSLTNRGMTADESQMIPVLFNPATPDNKLYRGYGVPAQTGVAQKGVPDKRRTLGAFRELPSGIAVPNSYELSGVVLPISKEDLARLTESENSSAGNKQMYTGGTLSAAGLSAFFGKDGSALEEMLANHEDVAYYKPAQNYSSPTAEEGIPLSYIAVVVHGARQIDSNGDFATHMLDNTVDLKFVVDDVEQGNPDRFLYSKAKTGDQFTKEDVKFVMDYLSSHKVDLTPL